MMGSHSCCTNSPSGLCQNPPPPGGDAELFSSAPPSQTTQPSPPPVVRRSEPHTQPQNPVDDVHVRRTAPTDRRSASPCAAGGRWYRALCVQGPLRAMAPARPQRADDFYGSQMCALLAAAAAPTPSGRCGRTPPPVRSRVGCALLWVTGRHAISANKILISGTRGAFRSGNRSSVMMLVPRYWVAAVTPPPPSTPPPGVCLIEVSYAKV